VLTYVGALLLSSYEISTRTVALALAMTAAAMLPGTFAAGRRKAAPTAELLVGLTLFQAGAVVVLGALRADIALTLAVLAAMAYVNGRRSVVAGGLGMDAAPEDPVAVMSVRAAANQFGYLVGAAAGGVALAAGGFAALGVTLAAMFAASTLAHTPALVSVPRQTPEESPA